MTMPAAPTPPEAPVFDPAQANFAALEAVPPDPDMATIENILTRFAADNGLGYHPRTPGPDYPGCIFTTDTAFPFTYHHFTSMTMATATATAIAATGSTAQYVDFGNLRPRWESDAEDAPVVHLAGGMTLDAEPTSWGYLALKLDRNLPNLLLTSKRRAGNGAKLPVSPDDRQILSLEGDFDRYFTLYCPQQFESDALYVFTPDLMALLIDKAAPFDVEIVEGWMFFYVPKAFDSLDPAVYRRLFAIVTTIGAKLVRQTAHYDNPTLDRAEPEPPAAGFHWNPSLVPDRSVPPGERLRMRSAWPQVLLGLLAAAAVVAGFIWLAQQTAQH
jgi:hypothetical protein